MVRPKSTAGVGEGFPGPQDRGVADHGALLRNQLTVVGRRRKAGGTALFTEVIPVSDYGWARTVVGDEIGHEKGPLVTCRLLISTWRLISTC